MNTSDRLRNRAADEEALKLIEAAKASGQQTLSLARLRIVSLPDEIADLAGQVESLDLSGCWCLGDVGALAAFERLRELNLHGCEALSDLSALVKLPCLTRLSIGKRETSLDLGGVGRLTTLRFLDLSRSSGHATLGKLAPLVNLEELLLERCFGIRNLQGLEKLTSLRRLDVSWCSHLTNVSALQSLTALRDLDVSECRALPDISAIGALLNLERLNLEGWGHLTAPLEPLSALTQLREVSLSRLHTLHDLSPFRTLVGLRRLKIKACPQLTDLSTLVALTALEVLELGDCENLEDLRPLASLTNLRRLVMEDCQLLTDLTPLAPLTRLKELALGWCRQLINIEPLGRLTGLERLELIDCELLTDISPLRLLPQLRELSLYNNDETDALKDISALSALRGLRKLSLAGCAGIEDLRVLAELSELQELDLGQILALKDLRLLHRMSELRCLRLIGCDSLESTREIAALTRLEAVDLSYCTRLTSLEGFECLTSLDQLALIGCAKLTDLRALRGLPRLREIDLSESEAFTDVAPLGTLANLQKLHLGWCRKVKDVAPLGDAAALQELDLAHCPGLTDVGALAKLGKISNLTVIGCSNLQDLPHAVTSSALIQLRASNVLWDALDMDWLQHRLPRLREFVSDRWRTAPPELRSGDTTDNCLPRLLAWHAELRATAHASRSYLKIFVLGNSRSGKTQICRVLTGTGYDETQPSTHGILRHTFELLPETPSESALWALLLDMGGQDVYLGTHTLFPDEDAVFLVVWTPAREPGPAAEAPSGNREGDKPLQFWLDWVYSIAGSRASILVVQAQCDRESDYSVPPMLGDHGFTRLQVTACSAKYATLERISAELRAAGRYRREVFGNVLLPKPWVELREALERRAGERTLEHPDFERLCRDDFRIVDAGSALRYLHQSAAVFWRSGVFGNRVILDQAWALQGLYDLVEREQVLPLLRSLNGVFTPALLAELLWKDKFSPAEQVTFIEMMEQCAACFPLDGEFGWDNRYVALESLPPRESVREREEKIWRQAKPDAAVALYYEFLHVGVLRNVIAAIGRKAGADAVYWRDGLCYYDAQARAAVRIGGDWTPEPGLPGAGMVLLEATGPEASTLLADLIEYIDHKWRIGRPPSVHWLQGEVPMMRRMSSDHGAVMEERLFAFGRPLAPGALAQAVGRSLRVDVRPTQFLVLATEWFSHRGGLSTLSRDFCTELVRAKCVVVCAVPAASSEEIAAAERAGVELIVARDGMDSDELGGLLRLLPLPDQFLPEVVVGHGRITGPAARAQVQDHFPWALRVHMVHMAAEDIEWLKNRKNAAQAAAARSQTELELCMGAQLVVPIGPRLEEEVRSMLEPLKERQRPPVLRLNPGFSSSRREKPPKHNCLVLGRAEDLVLKGLDIAARAVAIAAASEALRNKEIILVVRGAPPGEAAELHRTLREYCGGLDLQIRVREFTGRREDVEADIRRASLVLMPSRSEGFGLVAQEAISLGTPTLLADRSGIAQLIREHVPSTEGIVVRTPEDLETAAEMWAPAIASILVDPDTAFARAGELSERLAREITWAGSIELLLKRLSLLRQSKESAWI